MSSIKLEELTKVYDDGTVGAKDVDFTIDDSEFVVLVGPSGCGKTTTLEAIAGLQRPTEGNVRIGNQVMNDVRPQDRDIAMVFQDYALYPHKTVKENMFFGLKYSTDMAKEEKMDHVEETANLLDIEHLLDQKPDQLSGGQQQRVALGRAIVRDPVVFLLDEPLSNLDAKLRTQMRAELQSLQEQLGVTTVYVTHDQTEAMTMGDRIAIMNDSKLQQLGTPTEVYNEPINEFVAQFIGSPSMNIIEGKFQNSRFVSDAIEYKFHNHDLTDVSNGEIHLGVRPEDLWVARDQSDRIFTTEVNVVEELGSENLLHLDVSNSTIVARVDEKFRPSIGETIDMGFAEERVYLFGPDSKSIKHRVPERKYEQETPTV